MGIEKPIVLITMGDPSGVGPEVILKALRSPDIYWRAIPVVLGDPALVQHTSRTLGIEVNFTHISDIGQVHNGNAGPYLLSVGSMDMDSFEFGVPKVEHVNCAIKCLFEALDLIRDDMAQALVTAPIGQHELVEAGYDFPGQSELLQQVTQTTGVYRMLVGDQLKISLVSGHVPINDVSRLITMDSVFRVIDYTHRALTDGFDIHTPRIAVTSLNPHSGRGGQPRAEEEDHIKPAIAQARAQGMNVQGPMSSSEMLVRTVRGDFDAGVAMMHDQGVSPFKLLHLDLGLTVTLGLPFVRTAPVHGPAFEVAGQGRASSRSMLGAIITASNLAMKHWIAW